MEELMEKNKPIALPKVESHPTEKEWAQMMTLQLRINKLLERLVADMEDYPKPPSLYPVTEKLAAVERELTAIRQAAMTIEQAGRKKERRISLPKVPLPRPIWAWLWIIPILVGLYALWPLWAILWSVVSSLLQPLP